MKIMLLLGVFFLSAVVTGEARRILDVEIRSEACGDSGKLGPGCGWAFIKVDGKDLSPHKCGHNIVVLNAETGAVIARKSFDTHDDLSAGSRMEEFLYEQRGRIVLVAIQDEGSLFSLAAYKELEVLGTGNSVFPWYRGSYALVGYGLSDYRRPSWVKQEQYPDSLGPSVIKVKIPLRKQPYL